MRSCESVQKQKLFLIEFFKRDILKYMYTYIHTDHVERKVTKYENHKLRERKVKTLTRN